jgi:hypothetical protein
LSAFRISYLAIFAFIFISLSGCTGGEPAVVEVPDEISKVTEPFLKAMKAGDREQALKHVSSAAQDEFTNQFAADHKKLASAPNVTPRFVRMPPSFGGFESDSKEANIVYAVKKGEKWTTASIRLYRYRDEPYVIEYWRVNNKAPEPVIRTSTEEQAQEKVQKEMMPAMIGSGIILAILGIIGIALLVWLVKRKPHVVSPEVQEQNRRHAVTVREAGEEA